MVMKKLLRERINTLRKKMVRMKGQWTPRGVIRFCGWLHARRRQLQETDHGYTSPFMVSRQIDFGSYSARLYDVTAKILEKYLKWQEKLELELRYIEEKLEACEDQIILKPVETRDKRYNGVLYRMMNSLREDYRGKEQMHAEVVQIIDASRLETEEMKYSMKSKIEAQLTNYLQGAHCFRASRVPELSDDMYARNLYETYCEKHAVQKVAVEKKEADHYVA